MPERHVQRVYNNTREAIISYAVGFFFGSCCTRLTSSSGRASQMIEVRSVPATMETFLESLFTCAAGLFD